MERLRCRAWNLPIRWSDRAYKALGRLRWWLLFRKDRAWRRWVGKGD